MEEVIKINHLGDLYSLDLTKTVNLNGKELIMIMRDAVKGCHYQKRYSGFVGYKNRHFRNCNNFRAGLVALHLSGLPFSILDKLIKELAHEIHEKREIDSYEYVSWWLWLYAK